MVATIPIESDRRMRVARQWEPARRRIAMAGLKDQLTVKLHGDRDHQGDSNYDQVAGVDMFEPRGLRSSGQGVCDER